MSGFCGHPTEAVSNAFLRVEYLTDVGPRIARLFVPQRELNLLAELPDVRAETPHGTFQFMGGHRLWHAPEASPRTYIPDQKVSVEKTAEGVRLSGATEPATGMIKTIEIRLAPDRPIVAVRHELTNDGLWQIDVAAWALTMFPLGGVAVLPLASEMPNPSEFAPDRKLIYWPYTRLQDRRPHLADDFVLLTADPGMPPCKIGYFNRVGWLGYWLNDLLLIKRFSPRPGTPHADDGCNTEVYCDDRFVELETLGPLVGLRPGETVVHEELWEVHRGLDQGFIPPSVQERVRHARAPVPE